MTSSIDRFRKRQKLKGTHTVYEINDEIIALSEEFLASETDTEAVEELFQKTATFYDVSVSPQEVDEFLDKFEKDFNQEKFHRLIEDCKKEVIHSIVMPFGLGKIVAGYDKVGGNVDTVHNVREGVYATQNEKNKYENRGKYKSDDYHKEEEYKRINAEYSARRKEGGGVTDYLTGEELTGKDATDLDHVVSAKDIHNDSGRALADIEGAELANTETNLKPTEQTLNRSKKADPMDEFLDRKNGRLKAIKELENKDSLSDQEQKELIKLKKLAKIDDDKAKEADRQSRKAIDNKINKEYYSSGKFIKNTAMTSISEAGKMGTQQALGLVITEFFTATFDEIIDIYKNGFYTKFDNEFLSVLKTRMQNIASKLKDKWKDVAVAFQDGFISGFISNLVTTVINLFVTTAKRVVRIIREGLFSLFRAVKLLLFPPEGMTLEERMHEAKKLIATGLIVSVGVILEEYVEKFIASWGVLAPYANVLSTIFVGAVTGLSITMVVYYLDKKKDDKEMLSRLLSSTEEKYQNIESMLLLS